MRRVSVAYWVASCVAAVMASIPAHAQVTVSDDGQPGYELPIPVPPGIKKMAPDLALAFTGNASNDVLGVGWNLKGLSHISRCTAVPDADGVNAAVALTTADKLCLDGRRLIQTGADGTPGAFPQANDAMGQAAGGFIEYRSELDAHARIRAYGDASGTSAASGPAWFRVWGKDGRVYDYGASPVADSNSGSVVMGLSGGTQPVATDWLLTRQSDAFGNVVDYKYEQRSVAWGSGPTAASPTAGAEWALREIQYSGNKVIFNYDDARPDKQEGYVLGNKSVRVRRLNSVTTYINSPNTSTLGSAAGSVAVHTVVLAYEQGGVSGRSRLKTVRTCAGAPSSTKCLPPTTFTYSDGASQAFAPNAAFAGSALGTTSLYTAAGTRGVLIADFNGDGRADILVWDDDPTKNALYLSTGNGNFAQKTAFNVNGSTDNLFKSDGCYVSMISDINGDGLPDLFRYAARIDINGKVCATNAVTSVYKNNGDGTFTATAVTLPSGRSLGRQLSVPTAPNDKAAEGWTQGMTFYLLDVDGDGFPDLITALRPTQAAVYPPINAPSQVCTNTSMCTHLYKGDGTGAFTAEMSSASNLSHLDVYTDPDFAYNVASATRIADVNSDGLEDIYSGSGLLLSRGDWNFTVLAPAWQCPHPIDFNGDGNLDCMWGSSLMVATGTNTGSVVGNFNLTAAQLVSAGNGTGIQVADFDGDGRQDLLIATDSPAGNVLWLSNGDGSFRASSTFNLTTPSDSLFNSNGSSVTFFADFSGNGSMEMLRLVDLPSSSTGVVNRLYAKSNPTPLDQLQSVTMPTGIKTTLTYTYPASTDGRYVGDRGTSHASNPSVDKLVDTVPSHFMVKTLTTDSGVGTATTSRDYAYFGAKFSNVGRGEVGVRETRFQALSGDGQTPLSTSVQRSQTFPYIGESVSSGIYLTNWADVGSATPIKLEKTILCDALSSADTNNAVSTMQSCARTGNKTYQPYALYTVDQGTDVDAARTPLPTKTQRNTLNTSGLLTQVAESWTGLVGGVSQTYTTTTSQTPQSDVTACSDIATCQWQLARVASVVETRAVPGTLLTTQVGTATNAGVTQVPQSGTLTIAAFGAVTVGASQTLSAVLTNTSTLPLTISVPNSASVTGGGFTFVGTTCAASVPVQGSCTVSVKLTPVAAVAYSGSLAFSTGAGVKSVSLAGTGASPAVSFQPGWVNWGTIGVVSSSGDWPFIVNNSNVAILITAHAPVSGPSSMESWQGDSNHCVPGSTVLQPNTSCRTFFGMGTLATPGAYTATDQVSYQAVGVSGATFTAQQNYAFGVAATTANSAGMNFGHAPPNTTTATQTFTVTNNASGSPVNVSVTMGGASPANFPMSNNCGGNLPAGGSCAVSVAFNPTTFANGITAAVQIATGYPRMTATGVEAYYLAGPTISVPVTGGGQGSSLVFSPASYAFGTQATYGSYSTSVSVTNSGNIPTSGMPSGFQLSGPISITGCGAELAANTSCTLNVTWAPVVMGYASGSITNSAGSGGSPVAWTWSGTAVTPSLMPFTVVTSSGLSTTFRNPNTYASLVISSDVNETNNGDVNITTNSCTGYINAGATCVITFMPIPPECKPDNFQSYSYVTNATNVAATGSVYKSVTAKSCQ